MPETHTQHKSAGGADASDKPRKVGRYDWADPSVPAGDSPANFPRWPIAVAAVVWSGWIGFLVFMVMQRLADASA